MSGMLALPALLTLLNGIPDTLLILAAALLHEAGHALACLALGVPIRFFRPSPSGAVIGYDPCAVSYPREALIAAAGPAAGLIGAAALWLGPCCRACVLFGSCSLSFAVFNLLPVRGLDGGVILSALLSQWRGAEESDKILGILSPLCTVLLWMCAAAVQLRCGGNLSLLLISVYMLTSLAGA